MDEALESWELGNLLSEIRIFVEADSIYGALD